MNIKNKVTVIKAGRAWNVVWMIFCNGNTIRHDVRWCRTRAEARELRNMILETFE